MLLQLEQNEACQYDAISVIDTNETQLHKLCGQNQENIEVSLMMMMMRVMMALAQNPISTSSHIWVFVRQYGIMFVIIVIIIIIIIIYRKVKVSTL